MKVLVADGRGKAGAGAISLQGATSGDTLTGVFAQRPGGRLEAVDAGWFETTISVNNQIQQLLPLITTANWGGPKPVFTDLAGNTSNAPPADTREPGYWRFVFLLG